jgi:hypothetical protein
MPVTTGKGLQYASETDSVTSFPSILQPTIILLDARPGISVVTTTAMNAYTGTDLWDGRVVWNTTLNALMKYDLATTTWGNAVNIASSSTVAALIFGGAGTPGALAAYSRGDHVHPLPSLAAYAPLINPNFTGGIPLVPTAPPLTSNTQAASTGYTDAAVLVEKNRALSVSGATTTAITTETGRAEGVESGLLAATVDSGWIEIGTFLNGWAGVLYYRVVGNRVTLKGEFPTFGPSGTVVCALPSAIQPAQQFNPSLLAWSAEVGGVSYAYASIVNTIIITYAETPYTIFLDNVSWLLG